VINQGFQNLLGMGAWQQAANQGVPQAAARPTMGQQLAGIATQDFTNQENLQGFQNMVTQNQAQGVGEVRQNQAAIQRTQGQELYDLTTGQGQALQELGQQGHQEVQADIESQRGRMDEWLDRAGSAASDATARAEKEYERYKAEGADLMSATAYGMARDTQDKVRQTEMQMRASGANDAEIAQATQMARIDGARSIQANVAPMQEQINQYKAQLGMNVANIMQGEANIYSQLGNISASQGAQGTQQLLMSQEQRGQLIQAGMGMQQAARQQFAVDELKATQYELMGLNEMADIQRNYDFVSSLDTAVTAASLLVGYKDEGYFNFNAAAAGNTPIEQFGGGTPGRRGESFQQWASGDPKAWHNLNSNFGLSRFPGPVHDTLSTYR
jgi:hypothetical protein